MKKIVKFLLELIITIAGGYGLLCIIGILMAILEKLPLLIIIAGLFLLMILATVIEFK